MSGNNHAMDQDEVDDFLYGSDASENNYGTTSKSATKKDIEEDEEIYQQYNEDMAKRAFMEPESTGKEAAIVTAKEEPMDEDQQDDDDSDDDLDIILEDEDDDQSVDGQQPSSQKSQDVLTESTQTNDGLVNIKLGHQGKDASQGNEAILKSSTASGKKSSGGGVDIEKVGEYNGQSITDVDLDGFEDKPWRKPGADITDYFNFGFNELSWKAYCAKQKNMRDKNTIGKDDMPMPDFMPGMGDIPDFMKMGMMMPMMEGDMPMGMMDGGIPMGMPMGMMNPMMGMPPPPPPPSHRHQQMGGPPLGNPSSRSTGNNGDRNGPGNQNYGGSNGGHGHSYSRGRR